MLPGGGKGTVVACLDDDQYLEPFLKSEWSALKTGVLITFELMGPIHYERELDDDMVLIARR